VNAPPPVACSICHDRPADVQFPTPATSPTPGHFHPQECSDCHETLSVVPEFVFTHRNTPGNFGGTCLPCHEARRPLDHNVGKDCAQCHRDPTANWESSGASPHPDGNAQLTACTNCHESDRPGVTNLPAGTVQGHFSGNDCVNCHDPKSGTVTLFTFTHSVRGQAVTSCSGCHASQRPSGIVNSFDHSVAGTGDCAACHTQPGVTWAGASFSHSPAPSSCSGCHSGDRPGVVVNRFNHTVAGTGDCASCHRQPGVTWTGGIYNHSPTPSSCSSCHSGDRPTTVVNGFNHATSGTGDCAGCHRQPGVTWSGATFSHSPTPTTCLECHTDDRPPLEQSYPTSRGTFRHGQGKHRNFDCVRCHTQPGVSWGSSNPGGICNACHSGSGNVDD